MPADLLFPDAVLAALTADLLRRAPAEACGLLLGQAGPCALHVRAYRPTPNRAHAPHRGFVIDPRDFLAGPAAAVVGIFHSHPAGPASPSRADRDAAWPELLQCIAGRHHGAPAVEIAAFRGVDWRCLGRWRRAVADPAAAGQNRSV